MPKNIEIKARLRDREAVEALVQQRADHGPEVIVQEDVFFQCDEGRLKLRTFADGCGELIFYRRLDTEGPTQSEFSKAPTTNPRAMAETLGAALGTAGVVRKRRTLYLIGQTRVHLDEVDNLGHFLELEVVLEPGQSSGEGAGIASRLMSAIGVREEDLEARAYVDLLSDEVVKQ
jgi:predicted adenylyl cyclase CyaB